VNSSKAFRGLLVWVAAIFAAAWAVWLWTRDSLPWELKVYLNSRSSEIVSGGGWGRLPMFLVVLLFLASLVGLYCFWRPARILYCGALLLGLIQEVCVGPRVTTGCVAALDGVLSILCGMVLYMAFFSSVGERFGGNLVRRQNAVNRAGPQVAE